MVWHALDERTDVVLIIDPQVQRSRTMMADTASTSQNFATLYIANALCYT